jgi:hypothetical protein
LAAERLSVDANPAEHGMSGMGCISAIQKEHLGRSREPGFAGFKQNKPGAMTTGEQS